MAARSVLGSGAAITLFGLWFLWQAATLREGPGYAAIGPRVFPVIVGLGLLLSGLAVLLGGLRGRPPPSAFEPAAADAAMGTDWATLGAMAALLALYIAAYLPLGFVLSSTAFLVSGAWVLGSRAHLRDLLAGLLLSVAAYAVFTLLLGLELPPGPLPW